MKMFTNREQTAKLIELGFEKPKSIESHDGYWVVGFDTVHAGDSLNTWPKERVIAETENLRKLLENWGENEN